MKENEQNIQLKNVPWMEEQAMNLAGMMQTLSPAAKNKFLTLLDQCPVDDTPKDKEISLAKLSLLFGLRKALMQSKSPLKVIEEATENPATFTTGDVTVTIGQGMAAYLHMTPENKEKFKKMVYGTDQIKKYLAISRKLRQDTQH